MKKTLFLLFGISIFAQNPIINTNTGLGQYGYLEKDASTTLSINSNTFSNIYQLFGRTWLNSNNIFTYGNAVNECGTTTNVTQTTFDYAFGTNAIPGLLAYTSVHADYCLGAGNSYGGNPNSTGSGERQHFIFDVSDRPSDLTSNLLQINPETIQYNGNVVMSVKIDFGSLSSRVLQRFWIQNTGTLAENSEIANDGFVLYYEPATGTETFDGNESNAIIFGNYNGNATNNNVYGHDALNISIPAGGLRVYVVLRKFATCFTAAKTARVSLISDGLSFSPSMNASFQLARVVQTPASPSLINVTTVTSTTGALSGIYYIPSACFPTVASAVNALNTNGISGSVTFNVLAGYAETAPAGGFSITGTGTASNTITFVKFGTGTNPTFTAFSPQTSGEINNAIFKIIGGDFITIDGFTIQENASNTTSTTGTNNMTEFGVAFFYASTTNGAQKNMIKNCNISLNRIYTNTFGIYSNTRHSSLQMTTTVAATSSVGANSFNKIYSNIISNVNFGIVFIGSSIAEAMDNGNDIGGTSIANGNVISNWGNGVTTSNYSSLTSSNFCIFNNHQINENISYNTIISANDLIISTKNFGGILKNYSAASPLNGTTNVNTISNNTITLSNTPTTGQMIGISLQANTSVSNTASSININNNNITNCLINGGTSPSFFGILNNYKPEITNIFSNTIANIISVGDITGILSTANSSNQKINKNTIHSLKNNSTSNSDIMVVAINTTSTSASGEIIGNRIYGIENKATGSNPIIAGYIPNGGNWTFVNNMISLSNGTNTNGMQCKGVFDEGDTGTRNYFYNTIFIGGSSISTPNSVAFQYNTVAATVNINNNIFNMTRTGNGINYAIANLGVSFSNFNSNNNVLNATNSNTIAATSGITDRTFASWQTASGQDSNSLTDIALTFTDIFTADLHITNTCTDIESAGIPVSITKDFDETNRNTTTPDIGADEINVTKPTDITINALASTICLGTGTTITANSIENYSYIWSPATGLNTTSGATVTANPTITTTYTLTGTASNGCIKKKTFTLIVHAGSATWDPTLYSGNTPANWSSEPAIDKSIIFNGNFTSTNNISGCNCNVNFGNVVFSANHTLSLTNEINVNGGSATFENNSSLVQKSDVTNSGNITYKRIATSIKGIDYLYWSSPVEGQNVSTIYPSPTQGPRFTWNTTVVNSNGGQGNWQAASGTMHTAKGYIIRGSNNAAMTAQDILAQFIGTPRNGSIPFTINRGTITSSSAGVNGITISEFDDNHNLLGNPYPSAINALSFLQANASHLTNPTGQLLGYVKLWKHGILPAVGNNPFYGSFAANYSATDYETINFTGTTTPGSSTNIKAGQGFFVTMLDGTTVSNTVNFSNSMRFDGIISLDNTGFFRTIQSENTNNRSRIWLDLVDAQNNNMIAKTLIGYVNQATNDFDNLYDAITKVQLFNGLFSILNNRLYEIQGRAPFVPTDQVPIAYQVANTGNYIIAINTLDGIFLDNRDIFIKDNLLNTYHNIKQSPYYFSSVNGVFMDRFKIVYQSPLNTVKPELENISVYKNNEIIFAKAGKNKITSVKIFDISGRLLVEKNNINHAEFTYQAAQFAQQVLLVQVTTDDSKTLTKKVL
jgi:hypothetical protein